VDELALLEIYSMIDMLEGWVKLEENVGILLSSISKALNIEDKWNYNIRLVKQLCLNGIQHMCCQKIQMNHNLFCIRQNCNVMYRNGRADQIKITDESIIILKDLSKEQVFIKPMGDISLVEYTILDEWLTQSQLLRALWF